MSLTAPPNATAQSPADFKLADGDRVVFLGSTLIERDQSHGYLETALTARFHPHNIQFRNLGWSGDNVFGEARAGFGSLADGFAHLKQHVLALKPTVILLGYGANESFAGRDGLQSFSQGLATLLATLDETGAQIVFLSPPPHEDLGRPLPDPAEHNRSLRLYVDEIAKVAAKRQAPFINLFELLGAKLQPRSPIPLTDNGLHLTAYGYWRAAPVIEQALGLPARRWQIEIDAAHRNIAARGIRVSEAKFADGAIRFAGLDQELPLPPPPAESPADSPAVAGPRVVRVFGLPAGRYALSIDGGQLGMAAAEAWSGGVAIGEGPDFQQAERLRQLILAKNQLYFHRWRPQNETYLFGFRKHEQGQNAVEIPQFDPLVEAKEKEIHALAAPVARRYEITKVDEK
jgi:lysophospholipase L1-like esterase